MKTLCYIIALAALILLIGTAGAIETGSVTIHTGTFRCIIFLAVMACSVYIGQRTYN